MIREAPKIGRNEPCPCGSGKKYKKCCLNKAHQQPENLTWHRLRRAINGLPRDLTHFARKTLGDATLEQAWAEFIEDPTRPFSPEEPLIPVFMSWFLFHWCPPGKTTPIARDFLSAAPARRLDPLARRYIEAALDGYFSFFDVVSSQPGRGMRLRDVFTKETLEVTEHTASQTLRPGDIVLAFPVTLDGLTVLECCGPIAVPPDHKLMFIEWRKQLEQEHGTLDRRIIARHLQEILDRYLDLVEELLNPEPPELRNTDGERLKPQELHFDIESPQAAFDALWNLSLEEDPQVLLDQAERDEQGTLQKMRFPWLKPGNAAHKSWKNTILGDIQIDGKRLTVHVNSDERAERIRKEVEARLGGQVKYRHTVYHSLEKMLAEGPPSTAKKEDLPPSREIQEKLVEIMEAHWDEWVHTKIPALGDRTPLEATQDPEGRELLEALLNQIQRNSPMHDQLPHDYDPIPGLRARLGLESTTRES